MRAQVYEIVTDAAGVAQYAQPLLQFQYGLNGSVTTPCLVDGAGVAGAATLNPGVAVACSAGQMNWKGYQFPGLITDHTKTAKDTSVAGKWQARASRASITASRHRAARVRARAGARAFARARARTLRGAGRGAALTRARVCWVRVAGPHQLSRACPPSQCCVPSPPIYQMRTRAGANAPGPGVVR
jgi:hypothetical protein